MTPEERFQKIENALQSIAEFQAAHEEGLLVLTRHFTTLADAQTKTAEQMTELAKQMGILTDNINKFLRGDRPNGKQ